jgi:DNA-binding transcriptional LysR family regulator
VELRQLLYFDAVVRHGGFTRAAEQLHVAQPAVSVQIKRLEAELGVVLIHRTTRRLALTAAGESLLHRVRPVLAELAAVRAELSEISAGLSGTIRVGATPVLGSVDLTAALASFRREHPGVRLELRSGLVAELLAELDTGALDVAVGPADADLAPRYQVSALAEETLLLVVPAGRGLAGRNRPVRLSAVRDDPFVCLPAGSGLHALLLSAAAAEGFSPRVDFETYSPGNIRELVAARLGVALLAASVAHAPGPPIEIHPLHKAPAHPPIAVITAAGQRPVPAARAFVTHLRDHHASNGQR